MDSLESAIIDTQEEVAALVARRAAIDRDLLELQRRHRMLTDRNLVPHHHHCPHCGVWSVCPQAYGEDCPLEATAPADCRDDPYRVE